MTRHYPELDSASHWSYRVGNLIQPIRSTTQIWVMTRYQYGISVLVSQMSFGGWGRGGPVIAWLNVGRLLMLTKMLIWCFYLIVLQKCDHILTELWAQDESCPFARPVDKKQVKRPIKNIIFLYQKASLRVSSCSTIKIFESTAKPVLSGHPRGML